jgi:hypothetical protein
MLATYSELQTAIADHLHRDDLTSIIPTFIKLFESRANRHLRLSQQEALANLTLTSGGSSVNAPTGFLEALSINLVYPDGYVEELRPLVPSEFDAGIVLTAAPVFYYIMSGVINFNSVANQNYTIKLRYLKRWDIATDTTNWLLIYCPDCYLYGSLAASAAYIGEDERMALWQSLAADAITEANNLDNRLRNRPTLRTELAVRSFNIMTGQ